MAELWYALVIEPGIGRHACEAVADPALMAGRRGVRMVRTLELAGCDVAMPSLKRGDRTELLLPGYALIRPRGDDEDPDHEILRRIRTVPGVQRLLSEPIEPDDIWRMQTVARAAVAEAFAIEAWQVLDEVEITRGDFTGLKGVLVRAKRRRDRWCLSLDVAGHRWAIDVGEGDARRIYQAAAKRRVDQ